LVIGYWLLVIGYWLSGFYLNQCRQSTDKEMSHSDFSGWLIFFDLGRWEEVASGYSSCVSSRLIRSS